MHDTAEVNVCDAVKSYRGGDVALFPDPGDDPVARLKPLKFVSALYGTFDDLYPESIVS